MAAFATLGIMFVARPVRSFLLGRVGDCKGRKSILSWSLVVIGLFTTLISVLPSYARAGTLAPVLLYVLRFGQGMGWVANRGLHIARHRECAKGQASLVRHIPSTRAAPGLPDVERLASPVVHGSGRHAARSLGWRIPLLASAVSATVGLFAWRRAGETSVFASVAAGVGLVRIPLREVPRHHGGNLVLGSLAMIIYYTIFRSITVFKLSYGIKLGQVSRGLFLELLCAAIVVIAVVNLISDLVADRSGCCTISLTGSVLAASSRPC